MAAVASCSKGETNDAPSDEVEVLAAELEAAATRKAALDGAAQRLRKGLSPDKVLLATFLAGVRTLRPEPLGQSYHAVLWIESLRATAAKLEGDDPAIVSLVAVAYFKEVQAAETEPGWVLKKVDKPNMPASEAAAALATALTQRDLAAADAAVVALHRGDRSKDVLEALILHGSRGHADLGHEMIAIAKSWRLLERGQLARAEDALRALSEGLIRTKPDASEPLYLENRGKLASVRPDWAKGREDDAAVVELIKALRVATAAEASAKVFELLGGGIGPRSIWDAIFAAAAERLVRSVNGGDRIVAIHAMTATDAMRECASLAQQPNTQLLCLIQAAAWIPLFREEATRRRGPVPEGGDEIDAIVPTPSTLDQVFAEADAPTRVRRVAGYLTNGGPVAALFQRMRPLIPHAPEQHYPKLLDSIERHEPQLGARVHHAVVAAIGQYMMVGNEREPLGYIEAAGAWTRSRA